MKKYELPVKPEYCSILKATTRGSASYRQVKLPLKSLKLRYSQKSRGGIRGGITRGSGSFDGYYVSSEGQDYIFMFETLKGGIKLSRVNTDTVTIYEDSGKYPYVTFSTEFDKEEYEYVYGGSNEDLLQGKAVSFPESVLIDLHIPKNSIYSNFEIKL